MMEIVDLECEELSKSFGGVCALDGVSFSFPISEITAIIGPNGAGKTTLINVVTGFLDPDNGECFINGKAISEMQAERIVDLGVTRTFQELRLISQLTVEDNLLLAFPNQICENPLFALFAMKSSQNRENNAEATEILRLIGLEDKREMRAGDLSYGQKKLLTLGCCLATQADLLILDEPVSGIHPKMVDRILDLILDLHDTGKKVLFIEHDIQSVRRIADKVIVMDQGSIAASGAPEDILDRPEIIEIYIGGG